jgi:aryl-alcohol dehydrogenase
MKITAAVARQQGEPLSVEDVELETPREHEILVRVVATGVCHTDLVVLAGHLPTPFPVVLGHEGAGVVEQVGSAISKVKPGDHVVMTFNSCGTCPSCADHAVSYCHEFFPRNFFATRPDGTTAVSQGDQPIHANFFGQSSFATHAICHEANVVKVADDLELELLGPLACGIQTGAGAVMNSLQVSAGSSFVVFGAGSVGLSAIMAAKVVGASTIIAVDLNQDRLAMATELGATHTINPEQIKASEEVLKITGIGAEYSLDTTGIPAVIRDAVESLANRGSCGILGAPVPESKIELDETHFMSGGRRLMGIVEGDSNPDTFIPMLADLHAKGLFPFDKLVKFYNLDQINDAIHDSETGVAIKPIIRMR